MYREIITPTRQDNVINIPKEYWNQKVEILVLPFAEVSNVVRDKKNLKELLTIESIDIEEIKVQDWNIEKF